MEVGRESQKWLMIDGAQIRVSSTWFETYLSFSPVVTVRWSVLYVLSTSVVLDVFYCTVRSVNGLLLIISL